MSEDKFEGAAKGAAEAEWPIMLSLFEKVLELPLKDRVEFIERERARLSNWRIA